MREIFTSPDFTEVGYYKSILDEVGIGTFIKNENTGNPMMAGAKFQPSLCVVDDADYDEAIRVLKAPSAAAVTGEKEWICPSCGEKNPANFGSCWKCSGLRSD